MHVDKAKFQRACDRIHEALTKCKEINKNDMNKTMLVSFLLYFTELWEPDKITSRIQCAEIIFFKENKGSKKLDHIRNEYITNEFHIFHTL